MYILEIMYIFPCLIWCIIFMLVYFLTVYSQSPRVRKRRRTSLPMRGVVLGAMRGMVLGTMRGVVSGMALTRLLIQAHPQSTDTIQHLD